MTINNQRNRLEVKLEAFKIAHMLSDDNVSITNGIAALTFVCGGLVAQAVNSGQHINDMVYHIADQLMKNAAEYYDDMHRPTEKP